MKGFNTQSLPILREKLGAIFHKGGLPTLHYTSMKALSLLPASTSINKVGESLCGGGENCTSSLGPPPLAHTYITPRSYDGV